MAKRYSGRAVVSVVWDDRLDGYKAAVSFDGRRIWSGAIGAPRAGHGAVDSSRAYDGAAKAALSFANQDTGGDPLDTEAAHTGSGWHVGRTIATRWPKAENPARRRTRARKAPKRKAANPRRKRATARARRSHR